MMPKTTAIVFTALFLWAVFPAHSLLRHSRIYILQEKVSVEEIEKMLQSALERYKKGDPAETISLLAEAIMQIRNSMPLKIGKLYLCSEVRDYNDYDAKDGFVLRAGEPLLLYIEPEGYGIRKEENQYKIWISQDAVIKNEKGETIFQRNDWVEYNKAFPTPIIPFYLTNRVSDIPAGKYTYSLTLKDHHKNSFLTESFEFLVQ
jgi:hypothetical protein